MHIKVHSERANHQRMAAPVRFERDAPIGSSAAEESGSSNGFMPSEFCWLNARSCKQSILNRAGR